MLLDNIYLLYAFIVAFFVLGLIIIIRTRLKGAIFIIPLMVAMVTSAVYTYESILGSPTDRTLPKEFNILAWQANEKKGKIWIWVAEPNKDTPMAYEMPYQKPLHKELHNKTQEANESKGTKGLKGKFVGRKDNDYGVRIDTYKFVEQKHMQKDGTESVVPQEPPTTNRLYQ